MQPRDPHAHGVPAANTHSPTAVDRAIGARIRRLRSNEGLTLRGLGHTIGVSAVQLQRYENGETRVAGGRLVAIAEALGIPIEALLVASRETAGTPTVPTRSGDMGELVRIFSDIRDPAHRSAVLAFVRAMAPTLNVPLPMGPSLAPVPPAGINGDSSAAKS